MQQADTGVREHPFPLLITTILPKQQMSMRGGGFHSAPSRATGPSQGWPGRRAQINLFNWNNWF